MVHKFEETATWKRTLAPRAADRFDRERSMLRHSFLSAREKAAQLTAEIARDLPEFTVHDVTHLDALWEYCDIIAGNNFSLTPADAYLLGVAFLIHDAGMTLAAYKEGMEGLRNTALWADTIAYYARTLSIAADDLPPQIMEAVKVDVLRAQHALIAEDLAVLPWTSASGQQIFLIEEHDLRNAFGRHAGKVARSHWLDLQEVHELYNKQIGSPSFLPPEWNYDLLKACCLLRTCDAAHIDSRRAPMFVRTLRNISGIAAAHWEFQSLLTRPLLVQDRLRYSSSREFEEKEYQAWWLCYDALRIVDEQLRGCDNILSDTREDCRLQARGVVNIESPELFRRNIDTSGWIPVDASVKITEIGKIVKILGGTGLYGQGYHYAIRELIQNAVDATCARRKIQNREESWGEVILNIYTKDDCTYVDISDNGVGMSKEAIVSKLLNFGSSYWGSELARKELPTLEKKGFESIGHFGIGFFLAFMIASEVRVLTRHLSSPNSQTSELIFEKGLDGRPLLRVANAEVALLDVGTVIRLRLRSEVRDQILAEKQVKSETFVAKTVATAAALNVDLLIKEEGLLVRRLGADSWKSCDPGELAVRVLDNGSNDEDDLSQDEIDKSVCKFSVNTRLITDKNGQLLGRAFIDPRMPYHNRAPTASGVITVGGLTASRTKGLCGVFLGSTDRASRNSGRFLGERHDYWPWLEEQIELIGAKEVTPDEVGRIFEIASFFGKICKNVKMIMNEDTYIDLEEFSNRVASLPEVVIVSRYSVSDLKRNFKHFRYYDHVFEVDSGIRSLVDNDFERSPFINVEDEIYYDAETALVETVLKVWGIEFDRRNHRHHHFYKVCDVGRVGKKMIRGSSQRLVRSALLGALT